jgi:leucyl-tRNA synthetase
VKIVHDQWFMKYGDAAWKEKTREALDHMRLYPEGARKQFNHVIDWLKDWACARESGLGTRLPWDDRWLIESLSDSTIYMAYYTFAHLIERGSVTGAGSTGERAGVNASDLTDAFFDYVLLGEGSAEKAAQGSVTPELAEAARREFAYWYPLDFRNSGKDLVQNHLTFMIFNHVAVWSDRPGAWPRAIGVNGWVNVDGEKMLKSRGNFILLRHALDEYGATATRLALVNAGEGVDDANFDREFAATIERRVQQWHAFAKRAVTGEESTRKDRAPVDDWFTSVIQRHVATARAAMDETMFRSAFKTAFYDLPREWAWYVKRAGAPHENVLREYVDVTTRMLTPFIPHVAEDVHHAAGKTGFAIDAAYPEPREDAVNASAEAAEAFVRSTLEDAKEILKVTGITPEAVTFYTAPAWKRKVYAITADLALATDGRVDQGTVMKNVMQHPEIRERKKEVPKVAQEAVKSVTKYAREELERQRDAPFKEDATLNAAKDFLARDLAAAAGVKGDVTVRVHAADARELEDPAGKARHALPGRPAIYIV